MDEIEKLTTECAHLRAELNTARLRFIEFSSRCEEHPDGWDDECYCRTCASYADYAEEKV